MPLLIREYGIIEYLGLEGTFKVIQSNPQFLKHTRKKIYFTNTVLHEEVTDQIPVYHTSMETTSYIKFKTPLYYKKNQSFLYRNSSSGKARAAF